MLDARDGNFFELDRQIIRGVLVSRRLGARQHTFGNMLAGAAELQKFGARLVCRLGNAQIRKRDFARA